MAWIRTQGATLKNWRWHNDAQNCDENRNRFKENINTLVKWQTDGSFNLRQKYVKWCIFQVPALTQSKNCLTCPTPLLSSHCSGNPLPTCSLFGNAFQIITWWCWHLFICERWWDGFDDVLLGEGDGLSTLRFLPGSLEGRTRYDVTPGRFFPGCPSLFQKHCKLCKCCIPCCKEIIYLTLWFMLHENWNPLLLTSLPVKIVWNNLAHFLLTSALFHYYQAHSQ